MLGAKKVLEVSSFGLFWAFIIFITKIINLSGCDFIGFVTTQRANSFTFNGLKLIYISFKVHFSRSNVGNKDWKI